MTGTAVLTGADRALGYHVARTLGERDLAVVAGAADRETERADDLRERDGVTIHRADPRDEFDVERLMETAAKAGPGIGVVVPAATVGHTPPGETSLPATSYSAYDDAARTEGRGVFAAIREAVPHLRDDARIVVPVVRFADRSRVGPLGVTQAARLALMRGFAADLDVAVGAVALDAHPSTADDAAIGDAAALIAWAATEAPGLDGTLLDGSDRSG